ncbi:MAG: lipoate--protein ligase family protein, partial [Planctomycetaceae bacterium]
ALDEALLRTIEKTDGEPVLRLWEPADYVVVVGRANTIERNVNVEACRRDGVPIVRRCSGGGTVLLGPGSLVFSLVLRLESNGHLANVGRATQIILDRILNTLRRQIGDLERQGTSDLTTGDVKVSGNSQRWLRTTLLHHGTLLYGFDVARIDRYLTAPEREPDYRRGRSHGEFVTNLPLGRIDLRRSLIESWNATLPSGEWPVELVAELVRTRYSSEEWTHRL